MPDSVRLGLAGLVVAATAAAVVRRYEVRLTMVVAGLLLGALGGEPFAPLRKLLAELVNPSFVVPICTALGFAEACRAAGCDAELVRLLLRPARRARGLLLPAVGVLAFVVNVPIVSQTGTAATVGAVALPLLRSAGISPAAGAATLALGSSIGGELLNPAGTEYGAIIAGTQAAGAVGATRSELLRRNWPAVMAQGAAAILAAWWFSRRGGATTDTAPDVAPIRWPLALVPLLPLALLFLTARSFGPCPMPNAWFATPQELAAGTQMVDPRWIGAAMLVGVGAALLAGLAAGTARPAEVSRGFWAGAGHAYGEVVSLIVAAGCFAEGVRAAGLAAAVAPLAAAAPQLLLPAAVLSTGLFALLCGSGIAATQGLFPVFWAAAEPVGVSAVTLGAAMTCAAAAGRTASPVAAVNLLAAKLSGATPGDVARRNAGPILFGALIGLAMALRR